MAAGDGPTISIVSWETFQHYRDRDPPWIKLYRDILTSEAWIEASDQTKVVQIALMLLAARYKNAVPYKPSVLIQAAQLRCSISDFEEAIDFLLLAKFIEIDGVRPNRVNGNGSLLAKCYTEKERSEKGRAEQSRAEVPLDLEQVESVGPVERVFEHWKTTWNHPRAQLDPKRRLTIKRALKLYPAEQLCESISGYRNSPHHSGLNDRQTVYDEITLFLRDAQHIDAGLAHATGIKSATRRAKTVAELEAEALSNAKH